MPTVARAVTTGPGPLNLGPVSMAAPAPRILILNAALNGRAGNTAVLLGRAAAFLAGQGAEVREVVLAENAGYAQVRAELLAAQAILFGTGTHWDSWSSLLQRFLEEATPDEGLAPWFGKPAGAIVTMHSVGGKQVLSRLQGVLVTLGCLIPPMSGLVCSYANQMARQSPEPDADDLWGVEDIEVVAWNLLAAARQGGPEAGYRSWPVARAGVSDRWIVDGS